MNRTILLRSTWERCRQSSMKRNRRAIAVIFCIVVAIWLSGCGGGTPSAPPPPPPPTLAIATTSLPDGLANNSYNQTIQATGGKAPYTWTLAAGTLPHNLSLSASATDSVTISGTPDAAALGVAFTIQVRDSSSQAASQPYSVSIRLPAGGVGLSAASFDFGNEVIGNTSNSLTETLTNSTGADLAITNIFTDGTNAAEFNNLTSNCPPTLAAGSSCDISLTFAPTQFGPHDAVLAIVDDTADSPHTVALHGIGLTPGPNASFSAASLPFGVELVGTTSPARYVTLNNYGNATLNIASITTSGDFSETNDCVPSLGPGGTCTVHVRFAPSSAGNMSGELSVLDNAASAPQSVALSGEGSTNTPKLTGYCIAVCQPKIQDPACPVGQPSKTPATVSLYPCGPITGGVHVDLSRQCRFNPLRGGGLCMTE